MRKSDKKRDNDIRKALTSLCEKQMKFYDGFQWLTHTVNYANFPASFKVICVFDTNEQLRRFLASDDNAKVTSTIAKALSGLKIKLPSQYLVFDSEEDCEQHNGGNWQARLA